MQRAGCQLHFELTRMAVMGILGVIPCLRRFYCLVRDAGRRELLYELHRARAELLKRAPQAPETARVDLVYNNLVRMWAEV